MDKIEARNNLTNVVQKVMDADLILTVTEYLRAWGYEIPEEVKQRDAREPGRRQKIMFENKFYRATKAYFARLAAKAQRRLELHDIFYPRKAIDLDSYIGTDFFDDEEFDADVIRLLLQGVGEGAALFSQEIGIPLDYSGINKKVLAWAKKHAGRLVKDVDAATRPILKDAINLYVSTPGFNLQDLMDMLTKAPIAPLTPERALRIGVTETTRVFAKGAQLGAEQLKAEHPDVLVTMIWYTDNDDRVCDLCGPLHDTEVEYGGTFYDPKPPYEDGFPPRHVNCRCVVNYRTRIGAEYD
jgi:hypothetical protein